MRHFPSRRAGPHGLALALAVTGAVLLAACTDNSNVLPGPPDGNQDTPLPGLVVSEAHEAGSPLTSGGGASTAGIAYVSLVPGSLPEAVSVRIRNVTTGDPPTPALTVVGGGFDPVAVMANPEDRLELAILEVGGHIDHRYFTVPLWIPPIVVRTSPPQSRTDVALSVRPLVVFSEPVDPGTITAETVKLMREGAAVSGGVQLVPGSPFLLEVTPDAPLEPIADYELVVTTAVRDLAGAPLEAEVRVSFTTAPSTPPDAPLDFGGITVSDVTAEGVAYVSLPPGAWWSNMASVQVRNYTADGAPTPMTPASSGGFDPIAVPARAGDWLRATGFDADGVPRVSQAVTVPVQRVPTVVRSSPSGGRSEVPLASRPLIIFSEPLDPQSLGSSSVQLLREGSPVAATAALIPGSPFAVEVTPESPLEPATAYEVRVTRELRDLDGDALYLSEPGDVLRVDFTTASDGGGYTEGAALVVANATAGGAFDLDGYHVTISPVGSPQRTADLDLNTAVIISNLPPGDATIELDGVDANCTVNGDTSRLVALIDGGQVRVDFDLTCVPPPELASVRLVFSRWSPSSGHAHLWAMNGDGTNAAQLTSGSVFDTGPVVSPDGTRVAFSRSTDGFGLWGRFHMQVMEAAGTGVTQVTGEYATPWSWSPDGNRIAIGTSFHGTGVGVIGADGGGRTVLKNDGDEWGPRWSPDGTTLVFLQTYWLDAVCQGSEIWAMEVDGTNRRVLRGLADRTCSVTGLFWSTDGTRIFYTDAAPGEEMALWVMNADGTNAVRLREFPKDGMYMDGMTPDGRFVALTRTRSGPTWAVDVHLWNIEDGSLVRLTADGVSMGAAFVH